jgi:phosphotransferase system  glucose/maltose/N-acetylglucosamine-specific IIC component
MQTTQSGRLGYMKGMGIMAIITGTIVSIVGVTVVQSLSSSNYCTYYRYSNGSTYCADYNNYTDNTTWFVMLIVGIVYAALGAVLVIHATRKFNEISRNPAAPL